MLQMIALDDTGATCLIPNQKAPYSSQESAFFVIVAISHSASYQLQANSYFIHTLLFRPSTVVFATCQASVKV